MTLSGDTGRDTTSRRPQEMDAAAYLIRRSGFEPGQVVGALIGEADSGAEAHFPEEASDYYAVAHGLELEAKQAVAWAAEQVALGPETAPVFPYGAGLAHESESDAGSMHKPALEPEPQPEQPLAPEPEASGKPVPREPASGSVPASTADTKLAEAKPKAIVWKGFPKPR